MRHRRFPALALGGVLAAGAAGCGASGASGPAVGAGRIAVVAAENQYGNVAAQLGGRYVHVSSVISNPNTDPHAYEISPRVAAAVGDAQLVIQNGLGYDDFITRLEAATPSRGRRVVTVARLLGLPASTANPHVWYDPATMPAVARAVTADLSAIAPSHAAYFHARLRAFAQSLQPWLAAIAAFRRAHPHAAAAVSEPVADDLLRAMGVTIRTPFAFQAAVMNGTDPAPQDIAIEQRLLRGRAVAVFCYNAQVADSLTASMRALARAAHVPVVAVYETMPTPGYTYQSWMLAETAAITRAVVAGTSTRRL